VLEKCHFLLELFGELVELILGQDVLLLALADSLAFIVEEAAALLFSDYLR